MDNNIVLKMEKICKYYPGVTALDHVDFELRKGEVHALLGENGAGKSTLCKIIAGAQPMDDGSYCLDGEQIRTLTPQSAKDKGVSMIYQEFNLVRRYGTGGAGDHRPSDTADQRNRCRYCRPEPIPGAV